MDAVSEGRETVVLGNGPVAAAAALFAARHGPVLLAGRPASTAPAVESVPAAALTLLLELGITPAELGVDRLTRDRTVAWDQPSPERRTGPACAHVDRAGLVAALWRRVHGCAGVRVVAPVVEPALPGLASATRILDATGRRALTADGVRRPPQPWLAAQCTLARGDADPGLRLAATPDGYAWRLGSARLLTVGVVGPGTPPRDAAALDRRIRAGGAGWLLDGVRPIGPTSRRLASAAFPQPSPHPRVTAIGDAALTRDALASQGTSIGLSDAAAADGGPWPGRTGDGRTRHLRSLAGMLDACSYRDSPAWSAYREWVTAVGGGCAERVARC